MEFKLTVNYVLSKELTIEADDTIEALDKAHAMTTEPVPYKELTLTEINYGEISPIKWMDEKAERSKP